MCIVGGGGHLLGVQNEVGVGVGGRFWMQFVVPVFTFDRVFPSDRGAACHPPGLRAGKSKDGLKNRCTLLSLTGGDLLLGESAVQLQ